MSTCDSVIHPVDLFERAEGVKRVKDRVCVHVDESSPYHHNKQRQTSMEAMRGDKETSKSFENTVVLRREYFSC
jgi:hypothetical protein